MTTRYSKANQLGLLGYGGANEGSHILLEASSAVFVSRELAIGVDIRQKANNLGLGEQDWRDLFIAWIPNKHMSVTAAYLDLGGLLVLIIKLAGIYRLRGIGNEIECIYFLLFKLTCRVYNPTQHLFVSPAWRTSWA